jgi:hypothetical protein
MGLSSKVKLGNEELKLYLPLLRWTLRGDDGRSASHTLPSGRCPLTSRTRSAEAVPLSLEDSASRRPSSS